MGALQQALLAESSASGNDPNYASVKLLCHFDGTNGQTTFTDNSPVARTLSRTTCSVTTTGPLYGTGSGDFSGGGNILVDVPTADWNFGSGQFTVEAAAYFTAFSAANTYGFVTQFGASSNLGWFLGIVAGSAAFYYSTTGSDVLNVGAVYTPTLNTWVQYAADRDASNVLRVYADGAVIASATVSSALFASTQNCRMGNDNNLTRSAFARLDEVRVTKGVARYAGAYTPAVAAFPNA